jgi:hypothetical protein
VAEHTIARTNDANKRELLKQDARFKQEILQNEARIKE